MIALTRITSKTVISKGFRLRGAALEKIPGGSMYSGQAERVDIPDLQALALIIGGLSTRQALAFGTVILPGERHTIVTKKRQAEGVDIARSRKFFEFGEGQEGILLLDYDPPKSGDPLSRNDLMTALHAVCPALQECETLISASASSFIHLEDGTEMRGSRGWHVFVRVENAADIVEIGESIADRCWLAGFGHLDPSKSDAKNLRTLIDTSVWQPERLSFDGGADCGNGLMQKRPAPEYRAGRSMTLEEVALTDQEQEQVDALKAAARGDPPPADPDKPRKAKKSRATTSNTVDGVGAAPIHLHAPLAPAKASRIMQALLHIPLDVDYYTWLKIGMGLKSSCGEAGFALWNAWCSPSPFYKGSQSLRAKWCGFDRSDVTLGTVFHTAKQYGWTAKKPKLELPLPIRELPADQHEPLAACVSVHKARDITLKKLFSEVVKNDAPAPLSSLRVTVGVGKSSGLKAIIEDAKREKRDILIVGKDQTQCKSYEEAGAFWRHGRENTEEGFTPTTPWHCPNAGGDGPVAKLAESEHRLQQMCKGGHCEHGNKAMLDQSEITGREPSDQVIRFFREFPQKRSTPACGWFDHMGVSQRHQVRVVTAAGLSPADLKTQNGKDVDHLIIDEGVEWSHSHRLDLPTIRSYIESLQSVKARLTNNDENAPTDWLDAPVVTFRDLAIQMGQHAAKSAAGEYTPVSFDLPGIVGALGSALDDHGSAIWEKPQWERWTDLVKAPLRALAAIKDGIEAGSLTMIDGALHVTYLHSVVENAIKKNIPITVMDATLDATASALVPQEHVTHIVAEPNCDWITDPRWFMSAKKDDESLKKESVKIRKTWAWMEKATGFQSYLICRRTLALFMLSKKTGMSVSELLELPKDTLWDMSIAERIGWYGWHDVAHNEWNGLNCILWGQMPVPDHVRLQQYMDHRSLLMQVMPDLDPLPIAKNEWAGGQWIGTGDQEQESQARLPQQPEVREWLLRKIGDQKIQAAGRTRAVCQDRRVTIWQVGGYPMTGLAAHGIRPRSERLVDGLSGSEVAAIHQQQRMSLITEAAAGIVARGDSITREKIRLVCKSLIANKSSGAEPVRDWYIYINQPRTGSTALDASKNNELDEDGLWNDEYAKWKTTAVLFAGHFDIHDSKAPTVFNEAEESDKENIMNNIHKMQTPEPPAEDRAEDWFDVDPFLNEDVVEEAHKMVTSLVGMSPDAPARLVELAWRTIDFPSATKTELLAAKLLIEIFEQRPEDVAFPPCDLQEKRSAA
ncbi:hypothetical protein BBC27_14840 [Acidithiobacillus ferrivorans]|uniref:Primase C-terminal 2 domain-containing protein n=1 Tax=Acidithiobacillus ferrivorans TaxID=160808 RepID=A0A1B9BWG5_9PROT|nr:PriCT-2 domain-containing protein [Acidithiobacillus ferrivorans]OCB02036.1 hypothetical protein BBC27_14840 [Acidithiobacillus ferrivorans]